MEKYAASVPDHERTQLRQLAVATARMTQPLCVEYIGAAEDGLGRLYSLQISAQQLSREARCLVYGQSHKEIDISGAHYETIRRTSGNEALPPITQFRAMIRADCQSEGEEVESFIKLFPLRLLGTHTEHVLTYAFSQGYTLSSKTVAVFRVVEAMRDIVTPKILGKHRNQLEVTFGNRNYHACETIESLFMQTFYRELCSREQLVSAVWLHDGVWVNKEVSDEHIREAEVTSTYFSWLLTITAYSTGSLTFAAIPRGDH